MRAACLLMLVPALTAGEWNGGIPGAYLSVGASARSLAMGGLDVVLGQGHGAAYGNPAQIGLLADRELSFTHVALYENASLASATAALPGQSWGGLTLGVIHLRCDGFEQRGEFDNRYSIRGDEFGTAQTSLLAGWGRDLSRYAVGSSVGGRLKLATHSMLDERAVGFGVDVGIEHRMVLPYVHRWLAPVTLGVSATNLLGPRLRMDQDEERFAARLDVGASYEVAPYGTIGFQACVGGKSARPLVVGVEGWPREELAVRIGGNDTEITAGVGLRWKWLGIDYGVAWHEEFSSSHRLSLVVAQPRQPSVDAEGLVLLRDASRWVVQHYRDPEAAHAAHRMAQATDGGRAARLYRFIVGQHPSTLWAAHGWRWFGDRSYDRSDWESAESNLLRLYRHSSRDEVAQPVTWFRLGDSGERLRHWSTAVQGYELVMADPDESTWREESFFRAGAVYFLQLRDYSATVRVYENAVNRYPARDLADAYFALGRSYAALDRWQTCVERMDTFLERYPGDPRVPAALFWSGRALYELGLPEEALPRLERVVEGYPHDEVADDAILFKGHCRRLSGDLALARIEYARVVKDFPSRDAAPLAQLALGIVLQDEGSRELAAREFRRFIANYPTHPGRSEAEERLRAVGP